MKIRRILSSILIFLTLLCSTESFSQIVLVLNDRPVDEIQYVEFSQDLSQEFRESIKIEVSEETESQLVFISSNFPDISFILTSFGKYQGYTKAYQFNTPPKKLFIDFGSILI